MSNPSTPTQSGIEKTPGICGGERVSPGREFPSGSWSVTETAGYLEKELLKNFPTLTAANLANAWEYAVAHSTEISEAIRDNGNEE